MAVERNRGSGGETVTAFTVSAERVRDVREFLAALPPEVQDGDRLAKPVALRVVVVTP